MSNPNTLNGRDSKSRIQQKHGDVSGSVLEVRNLQTHIHTPRGPVKAVDDVSFSLNAGEVLAVVGESGSGKSLMALSLLRLLPAAGRIVGGSVRVNGREILKLLPHELRKVRGNEISMIFQEPMTSLNPVLPIGRQISEALRLHQTMSGRTAMDKSVEMLRFWGM